jgi:glutaredoxin-like protein NrdH
MLDKKFIEYSEIDISVDHGAYDMVKGLGYTAAPVVVAGDEHWSGFRPDLIESIEI